MSKRPSGKGAFTLVEMLVSTAIMLLLIVLLFSVTDRIGAAWVQSHGVSERRQSVRIIADMVARDLRGALAPLAVDDQESLQFLLNPPILGAEYRNADCLFWQAPVAANSTRGDIAELGYFVRWFANENGSGGPPLARLCRFYVDPTQVDQFRIYSSPQNWLDDELLNSVAPAGFLSQANPDNYRGLLAENVVGFWARCIKRNSLTGLPEMDGTQAKFFAEFDSRAEGLRTKDHPFPSPLPMQLEISFAVIDSPGAARMTVPLMNALREVVASAANADDFLSRAKGDGRFAPLLPGLRVHTVAVALKNSR